MNVDQRRKKKPEKGNFHANFHFFELLNGKILIFACQIQILQKIFNQKHATLSFLTIFMLKKIGLKKKKICKLQI